MYKKNDYVIYKREVCCIKDITMINTQQYYILENLEDPSLKVSLPVSQEKILLRALSTFNDITNTLDNLDKIEPLDLQEHNLEEKYKVLLQGNTLSDLIIILKTTFLRNKIRENNKKRPSDKDTYYNELAEKYLFNEISYSMQITYNEAKELFFNKLLTSNHS